MFMHDSRHKFINLFQVKVAIHVSCTHVRGGQVEKWLALNISIAQLPGNCRNWSFRNTIRYSWQSKFTAVSQFPAVSSLHQCVYLADCLAVRITVNIYIQKLAILDRLPLHPAILEKVQSLNFLTWVLKIKLRNKPVSWLGSMCQAEVHSIISRHYCTFDTTMTEE